MQTMHIPAFDYYPKREPSYKEVYSTEALLKAYQSCTKGKSGRTKYRLFALDLAHQIKSLQSSLRQHSYTPQPYHQFKIFCQSGRKIRLISEPAAIDNLLQHALYNSIYSYFDSKFIYDSYGCRKNKGTHKASDRCQLFIRCSDENSYYLQLDIRKFYYSINHNILRQALEKHLVDKDLVDILMLQTAQDTDIGLNVGAMMSQLFGLIYLNKLDHYIKRELKVKRYIRYVDDMVIIGESREKCLELLHKIQSFVTNECGLEFSKIIIQPLKHGINFVGFRTWRHKRLVRKYCLKTFKKNVKRRKYKSIQAQLAHAKHTSSYTGMLKRIAANFTTTEIIRNFSEVYRNDLLIQKSCDSWQRWNNL